MSVEEVKQAITRLPPQELTKLSGWLADYHAEVWDQQIASDLDAGRLDTILEEADQEYEAGKAKPL
ncbi:MAG: hypothetical protein WA960_11090 [Tunicatimonas sp.]